VRGWWPTTDYGWPVRLEPETLALLRDIADAARAVPRDEREFMVLPHLGGCTLMGPGQRNSLSAAEERDIRDLAAAGLLRIRNRGNHSDFNFTVAPEAYELLEEIDEREPLIRVEQDVTRYLDSSAFRQKDASAHQRWEEAAALLWGPNAENDLTTIGHKTREAVQEFASRLVEAHGVSAPEDSAKTVARLKAVVDSHRDRLGEARHHLLDALVSYWGEVNDLLQRQEHGGQKEGEPLAWEDGRRAVFQTALVMYEVDRTL
jgi:hypothetical protein